MTNTQILDSIHSESNNINSLVLKIPLPFPIADSSNINLSDNGMLLRSNKCKKFDDSNFLQDMIEDKKEILEDIRKLQEQFGNQENLEECNKKNISEENSSQEELKIKRASRFQIKKKKNDDFVYNEEMEHFVTYNSRKRIAKRIEIPKPMKTLENNSQNNIQDNYSSVCICGDPQESSNMIQCDKCNQWLHFKCAGLDDSTSNINEVIQKEFLCLKCLTTNKKRNKKGSLRYQKKENKQLEIISEVDDYKGKQKSIDFDKESDKEKGLKILLAAAENSNNKRFDQSKSAFIPLRPLGNGKTYVKAMKSNDKIHLIPNLSFLESLKGTEINGKNSIMLKNTSRNISSKIKAIENLNIELFARKMNIDTNCNSNIRTLITILKEKIKNEKIPIPDIFK